MLKYKTQIKYCVAILLFGYISQIIDVQTLISVFQKANLYFVLLAFIIAFLSQYFISNLKWAIILKEYDTSIPFKKLCDMYFVSMFFSVFLPGSHGGDIVRAYDISKYTKNTLEGVMSVVLERASGLAGLLVVLFFALLIVEDSIIPLNFKLVSMGLIVIVFCVAGLLLWRGMFGRASFLLALLGERFYGKVKEVYEAICKLKNKKTIVYLFILSLLFQLIVVLAMYVIAMSLAVEVPLSFLMLIIPLVSLLSMIPLTPNGIGVRDISYISLLGIIGVEKEAAFSIGLIQFIITLLMSLYGGFIYLRQK